MTLSTHCSLTTRHVRNLIANIEVIHITECNIGGWWRVLFQGSQKYKLSSLENLTLGIMSPLGYTCRSTKGVLCKLLLRDIALRRCDVTNRNSDISNS